jgi:hypothetical protein
MSAPPPGHALVIGIDRYPGFPPENQLDGCVHDARLMDQLLRRRFGFPRPRLLLDEAATREGILEALEELLEATGEGHRVVLHFSGHGSQMRDREGDEPDGYDETLVPHDSGRGSHPNRDISDDEIHYWMLRLTRRTDAVTLIFDCCHSATLSRDPLGIAVRRVAADHRPLDELPPSPVSGNNPPTFARSRSAQPRRRDGWASLAELGERYTLLAACRDDESAFEHRTGDEPHGAFTFFLSRELLTAPAGSSYRQVFQHLAPRLTSQYPLQHPQLEGARDRQLFGVRDLPAPPPIQVLRRRGDRVVLDAGTAHGLTIGSELEVFAPATGPAGPEKPVGTVRIRRPSALSALAEILREDSPDVIGAGCGARVSAYDYGDLRLPVTLPEQLPTTLPGELSERAAGELEELRRQVEMAPSLVEALPDRIGLDTPRARVTIETGDPCELCYAVRGAGGQELLVPIPLRDPGSVAQLIQGLQLHARFLATLALENRDPGSTLAGQVELLLRRQLEDGAWASPELDAGGAPFLPEGTRLGIEVHNQAAVEIYPTLLDFGLTGRVSLLHPIPGSQEPIPPGGVLRIGMRPGGAEIRVSLPQGHGLGKNRAPRQGTEWIKLFATNRPADFSCLRQPPWRSAPPPNASSSGLQHLLHLAATGQGARTAQPVGSSHTDDWTTIIQCFEVRERSS